MAPLIVATVTAPTMAELRRRRDAVSGADLIELRLDTVADPDAAGALQGRTTPVIVTCRPTWEGGHFSGAEETRRAVLTDALAGGAEYVDIEWRAGFADLLASTGGRRIVISTHDFDVMPADLDERLGAMRATGAEIVKVAGMADRLSDLIPLRAAGLAAARGGPSVVIGMGEAGLASRLLPGRFGSYWTYAGDQDGIGQVSVERALDEYRIRRVTAATALYGIFGRPVSHSVSPAMHNAAFAATGLDAIYLPLAAADADDAVSFGQAFDLRGASVTIPFKVPLMHRVAEVDDLTRQAGALNTIRVVDGRWLGTNTDLAGFLEPLRSRMALTGTRASILGCGGSARAVALALRSAGAHVAIHGRDAGRAVPVAAGLEVALGPWPPLADSWDLLVNCTPVGMHPHVDATPIDAAHLTGRLVYDLVYNPQATRLLRDAQAAGCLTIGGLDMLVAQAREQFRLWTAVDPPADVMRRAAEARLAEFAEVARSTPVVRTDR